MQITTDSVVNSDVYLLVGSAVDNVYSQQRMTTGTSVTISSKEVGILIVKGTFDAPFVSFTY